MNVDLLRGHIVGCGLNVDKLAKAAGMHRSTLYRKLSNSGDSLTIGEAARIAKILNLSSDQATEIFFNHFVA